MNHIIRSPHPSRFESVAPVAFCRSGCAGSRAFRWPGAARVVWSHWPCPRVHETGAGPHRTGVRQDRGSGRPALARPARCRRHR